MKKKTQTKKTYFRNKRSHKKSRKIRGGKPPLVDSFSDARRASDVTSVEPLVTQDPASVQEEDIPNLLPEVPPLSSPAVTTSPHPTELIDPMSLSERKRTGGPILRTDRQYTLGRRGNYFSDNVIPFSSSSTSARKSKSPPRLDTSEKELHRRKTSAGQIKDGDAIYGLGIRGHYPTSLLSHSQSDLLTVLQINFKNKNVNIEYAIAGEIRGVDSSKQNTNECFRIKITEKPQKEIKIVFLKCCPSQVNCTLRGPVILQMLTEIANLFHYAIFVGDDGSTVELSNPSKTTVDLSTLNIFLYGESFYNRQHFYSTDHATNKVFNQKIRKKALSKVLNTLQFKDITYNLIDSKIKVHDKMTIEKLAEKVLPIIRLRGYSDKFANALETIVVALKDRFSYNTKNLVYKAP